MVASAVVEPTLGVALAAAGPLDPLGRATGPGHPQAPSALNRSYNSNFLKTYNSMYVVPHDAASQVAGPRPGRGGRGANNRPPGDWQQKTLLCIFSYITCIYDNILKI